MRVRQRDHDRSDNPFLPVTKQQRVIILTYVVVLQVLLPGLLAIRNGGVSPLHTERALAEAAYRLLVVLPLVVRGTIGWLHPLVFPAVFGFIKGLPQAVGGVVVLFTPSSELARTSLFHPALAGWNQHDIAEAYLAESLLSIAALLVYYCGFYFSPNIRVPHFAPAKGRWTDGKLFLASGAAAAVCVAYIMSNGGVNAFMSTWAVGRFQALEMDGPVHVVIRLITVSVFVWYAFRPNALRNPLFLASLAAVIPVIFLSSGSRSGVLYTFVMLALIWMLRHQQLPVKRMIVFGAFAFVVFGMMGLIRWSVWEGEGVRWSALTDVDLRNTLSKAYEEATIRREIDGAIGVVGRVGQDQPLLMGESYVGAALFFIPRSLWREKPRGAGAIYVSRFYGLGERSYGIPVGPAAEAYWNFHLPGVVIVFALFGMIHRWICRLLARNPRMPAAWTIYVPTMFLFSPGTDGLAPYLHFMFGLIALLAVIGALRFRKRDSGSSSRRSVAVETVNA